jgi:hypothetical protein
VSEGSEHVLRVDRQSLRPKDASVLSCQVGASQTRRAKNLEEEATVNNGLSTAATTSQADLRGKIVELAWHLKKQGRKVDPIKIYSKYLTLLLERGANLNDPENVKDILSQMTWTDSNKKQFCNAYSSYCSRHGIKWFPPDYQIHRKLPFIPLEKELDSLIASCGEKGVASEKHCPCDG